MSNKDDVGLFLLEHFPQGGEILPRLCCRVIEATAYTAQTPADFRVLTYSVGFWPDAPYEDEEPKLFACPRTETTLFSMKVANELALDADTINTLCINHFLSLVIPGKPCRDAKVALETLYSINKAPWTYNSSDRRFAGAVYDVQHHQHFRAMKGARLRQLYATLSYSAMLTKVQGAGPWGVVDWSKVPRKELSYTYVDQTLMVDAAGQNMLTEEVVNSILTAIS